MLRPKKNSYKEFDNEKSSETSQAAKSEEKRTFS